MASKQMHAAVVNTWGSSPVYQTFELPAPSVGELCIKVLFVGVHNLVRSRASGKHYTTANTSPPHMPGVDGVGQIEGSDQLVYFSCLENATGSYAEYINVGKKDVYPIPASTDMASLAAICNPALSSWMALTARADVKPGSGFTVFILGATGVSGLTAVQISKALGATRIVTAGRNKDALEQTKSVGADTTIELSGAPVDYAEAADVDIVLDYLYGDVASSAMQSIVKHRKNKNQRLTWVAIGNMAGGTTPVDGPLLRAANIFVCGCGPGSWSFPRLAEELPRMLQAIVDNGLKQAVAVRKLADVEKAWTEKGTDRLVFEP